MSEHACCFNKHNVRQPYCERWPKNASNLQLIFPLMGTHVSASLLIGLRRKPISIGPCCKQQGETVETLMMSDWLEYDRSDGATLTGGCSQGGDIR